MRMRVFSIGLICLKEIYLERSNGTNRKKTDEATNAR